MNYTHPAVQEIRGGTTFARRVILGTALISFLALSPGARPGAAQQRNPQAIEGGQGLGTAVFKPQGDAADPNASTVRDYLQRAALLPPVPVPGVSSQPGTPGPAAGLTINAIFDSSITGDANAAAIQSTINTAIANIQSQFSDPITVTILFRKMTTGLGMSTWYYATTSYSTFINALRAEATTTDDSSAIALLPSASTNPVNGGSFITSKHANFRAVGLTSNPPAGGCPTSVTCDGWIDLNTTITSPGSPGSPGTHSLLAVAEHEIDEVLGLGSALDGLPNPTPEDLFRYNQSGNRTFTTTDSRVSGVRAYFSLDRFTDLAEFDNQNDGGDFGDWQSNPRRSGVSPKVQDAFATPGGAPALSVELSALDVIGYNRISGVLPPGAPTGVTGTAGNAQVAVAWTAPASNGGSAITGYQVQVATSANGTYSNATGCPTTSTTPSCTATGLTNGTAYFFKVAALNAAGTGTYSAASSGVTPRTVPGAPTGVTGTAGNGQVAVAWTAPANTGASAITGYQVQRATSTNGTYTNATGCPTNSTTPACTATGLTNGTPYFFKVAALNTVGTGAYSSASSGVTPATVPGAPTDVRAVAGHGQVRVSFAAPASDGGAVLTSYTVTASPGGARANGPGSPLMVTGLTNGQAYTFAVKATNSVGSSPDSTPSSAAAPGTFTDDPIEARTTMIKAVHVDELRSRIEDLRGFFGTPTSPLPPIDWTDKNLSGKMVQVVHIQQLRNALLEAYDAARAAGRNVTRPSFTDDSLLQQKTMIKAIHIAELRAAVLALEAQE